MCVCVGVCVVTVGARSVQRLLIATSLGKEICYKIYSKHETHEKVYKNWLEKICWVCAACLIPFLKGCNPLKLIINYLLNKTTT